MSSSDAGAVTTGFAGAGKSSKTDSPLGAFAAILNAIEGAATAAVSGNLLGAVTQLVGATSTDVKSTDAKSTDAAATDTTTTPLAATDAAAVDATASTPADTSTSTTIQPKLMADLVDSLTALQKAQSSGQPVGDDLLKRVKKAVDALAGFLAAQQPAVTPSTTTPATDTATAIAPSSSTVTPTTVIDPAATSGGTTDSASATGTAGATDGSTQLAPLAHKLEDFATTLAKTEPELSTKLTALAQSLGSGQLSSDTLTALGISGGDAAPDPKLTAAINDLVNAKPADATALQPQLAVPSLKLPPSSALSAGTADSKAKSDGLASTKASTGLAKPAAAPGPAPAPAASASTGDNAQHDDKSGNKPAETIAAAVAQATGNQAPDPSTTPSGGSTGVAATTVPAVTAQAATAAYQAATVPVNLPQMAFDIVRHMQQGSNQFQIRLDPADMGRIDVKLDIASSGTVNAHLTVEHPETLDLLKRDSGALGAALSQAGLDSSKTNLEFSLRQNPFANQNNTGGGNGSPYAGASADDADTADEPATAIGASTLYRGTLTSSGVNIFV